MNYIFQNSGGTFSVPNTITREATNPQGINYDQFFNKFYIVGQEINNDPRFNFKDKGNQYIIEYKENGKSLNSDSDSHLTLHSDSGHNNRFHVKADNNSRNVSLVFFISYNNGKYKLRIEKQNGSLKPIEHDLLNEIEFSFNRNYQSFLENEYYLTERVVRRSNNQNKIIDRKTLTFKQKYLKYKVKYLELKRKLESQNL